MAVAFDAVSSAATGSTGTVSPPAFTWTHTPVGTPTAVSVALSYFTGTAAPTAVSYGGVAMTLAAFETDGGSVQAQIWGLAHPPAGVQTVEVDWSGTAILSGGAITVTGSDLTTCFSTTAVNNGSGTSTSVVVASANGELVVDIIGGQIGGTPSVTGGSQTLRWGPFVLAGNITGVGSSAPATGSTTMAWSITSAPWAAVGASFKIAGGGCTPTGTLLGVEKCWYLAPLAWIINRRNILARK